MAESPQEHLLNHLRDVHALEMHSLRQLQRAAHRRDEQSSAIYEQHLEQSQGHEQKIKELVEGQGHEPSAVEDKTLRGRTIGLRQLADIALDTPVKLAMNLFALEHLEIAAYTLLVQIAKAAEDEDAARVAEEILEEERAAAEQVEGTFDRAVELLVDESSDDDLLLAHLSDVHAVERQSAQLLQLAVEEVCDDEQLKGTYSEHLEQTESHGQLMSERIETREAKPSAVKDLHLSAATSGLQELSDNPPDAEAKMAMNLFCVEYLKIAAYELLIRLAEHEGDQETAEAARKILDQERQAAEALSEALARTVELMLESDGSYEATRPAERPAQTQDGQAERSEQGLATPAQS